MPRFVQPTFSSGEISPDLHGRVDTFKYNSGLSKARNVFIKNYGGVANRPGLQYIGPVAFDSMLGVNPTVRLIPFLFNDADTYVLEMGNRYMRVLRNREYIRSRNIEISRVTASSGVVTSNAHGLTARDEITLSGFVDNAVLNGRRAVVTGVTTNTIRLVDPYTGRFMVIPSDEATGNMTGAVIYHLATPYLAEDLHELRYQQSNDVITLTHPKYAPRELTRVNHALWTIEELQYETIAVGPATVNAGSRIAPDPVPNLLVPDRMSVREGAQAILRIQMSQNVPKDTTIQVESLSDKMTVTPGTLFYQKGTGFVPQDITVDGIVDPDSENATGIIRVTASGGSTDTRNVAVTITDTRSSSATPTGTPVIIINARNARINEGETAYFDLTANPLPKDNLTVGLEVTQTGDFAGSGELGSKTVTVGTNGRGTLEVDTTDDEAVEDEGSITATVQAGTGYEVSEDADSATVLVVSEDIPSVAVVNASAPGIAINAVGDVTEATTKTLTVNLIGGAYDKLAYAWRIVSGIGRITKDGMYTAPSVSSSSSVEVEVTVTATGTGTKAASGTSDTATARATFMVVDDAGLPAATAPTISISGDATADARSNVTLTATLSGGRYDTSSVKATATGAEGTPTGTTSISVTRNTAGTVTVTFTATVRGTGTLARSGSTATATATHDIVFSVPTGKAPRSIAYGGQVAGGLTILAADGGLLYGRYAGLNMHAFSISGATITRQSARDYTWPNYVGAVAELALDDGYLYALSGNSTVHVARISDTGATLDANRQFSLVADNNRPTGFSVENGYAYVPDRDQKVYVYKVGSSGGTREAAREFTMDSRDSGVGAISVYAGHAYIALASRNVVVYSLSSSGGSRLSETPISANSPLYDLSAVDGGLYIGAAAPGRSTFSFLYYTVTY